MKTIPIKAFYAIIAVSLKVYLQWAFEILVGIYVDFSD